MEMQNTPDIETIRAAVAGEALALEKVLACLLRRRDQPPCNSEKTPAGREYQGRC